MAMIAMYDVPWCFLNRNADVLTRAFSVFKFQRGIDCWPRFLLCFVLLICVKLVSVLALNAESVLTWCVGPAFTVCSTSRPGGNQVDGLPPASSSLHKTICLYILLYKQILGSN